MTDTERSFMRAIIERPDCDLPRLAFADWLEENGEPDRAEFCRVQIELAELERIHVQPAIRKLVYCPGKGCETCQRVPSLRERERELLTAANTMVWGGCPALWAAGLKVSTYTLNYWDDATDRDALGMRFERGFVSEVRARLAVLVGGECERCRANPGWGYGRQADTDCVPCHGTGRTIGIAAEIAQAQPVTRWVATDKEPICHDGLWYWYRADAEQNDYRVRHDLFQHFGHEEKYGTLWIAFYQTRELALAALSDAISKHAKGECK